MPGYILSGTWIGSVAMLRRNLLDEVNKRDNWPEAVRKGIEANAHARKIVDNIITGKRRKPISQEAIFQMAAQLSQCLAAELQAFADLERLLLTREKVEAADLDQSQEQAIV